MGITITDQPGTVTDPRQYMENGQTQWKCVAARGGGNISEFSGYVDLAKVHGIKPEEYLEEDVYAGNSATSPNRKCISACLGCTNERDFGYWGSSRVCRAAILLHV